MTKATMTMILLAGCGVEPSLAPGVEPHDIREQSGTRLKIEWWETADGAQQFRGVFDSVLGQECTFQRGADGAFACVTATGEVGARATLDRQAAELDVVATSLCSADGFVQPFGFFDTARGAECAPVWLATAGAYACAPLGAAPDASDPVLALVADSDDGHRLEQQYFARQDGLRQHAPSFFDRALGAPCSVRAVGPSATAFCLPPPALRDSAERPLVDFVAAIPTVDP